MSKTALRRELLDMPREAIIQVVLDLYAARKEARDYLDFFINPDVDGRLDKARSAIQRELQRTGRNRRHSKARISRITAAIKEFASLQAGFEHEAELRVYAINATLNASLAVQFQPPMINGLRRLMDETISLLDAHQMLTMHIESITDSTMRVPSWSPFRVMLAQALENASINPQALRHK